jgi:excisionase family DNA binding protein
MTTLLSVREAAQLLKLSRQRIEEFILKERLPAQKVGTQWTIELAELERFQASRGMPMP